jgi:D-erythronate 2-dehydrogenase
MRVLVTGAAGFIGTHVVAALLARGELVDARGQTRAIEELVLTDTAPVAPPRASNGPRCRIISGDFRDPGFRRGLLEGGVDSVFHLAAMLTSEAERDVAGGMGLNLLAFVHFLDEIRAQERVPKLVFPSSIATFGGRLPDVVDESVAQRPQTSYGTQKVIAELLINDYARHGFVDGRSLRLPFVVIRPAPNWSVADRVAAIIREPLLGKDVVAPVHPETRVPFASVQSVARALLSLHDLPAARFSETRALNLPSLTVSVAEMVAALDAYRATRTIGRIDWKHDPALQAVIDSWPKVFVSEIARRNGIEADRSLGEIIDHFLADHAERSRRE